VEWAKRRKGLKVHPAAGEAISPEADSLMLEFLCRQAVDIVEEIAPPPKQPKGKPRATGSTILRSARAHYQQLTLLHRAWGKEGRFKKNTNMGTRDKARATAQIFKSWAKAETKAWAKATEEDPRPNVLEWGTAHPRKWWELKTNTLRQEGEWQNNQEKESLEDLLTIMGRDLAMVKRKMARLVQRDESADIKGHTRRNNELMVQGRMKTVIRKIIEKPD
jgi:hypothetical protein